VQAPARPLRASENTIHFRQIQIVCCPLVVSEFEGVMIRSRHNEEAARLLFNVFE
jgi:hypothetical protein